MAAAVEYKGVSFAYPSSERGSKAADGPRPALENVTLTVKEGERLGILGPNGGGKSTLLKLTLGLLQGGSGTIRIFGYAPEEARARRIVGYVPQRSEAEVAFPLCVRQVVEMAVALANPPWKSLSATQRAAVADAMNVVGVTALADRPISELSGGQFQRTLIARALAPKPRLLLLDEPTVGIDPAGQQQFAELLQSLQKTLGLTVVVVSHDLRTVVAGCDSVACLSRTLHAHTAPAGLTPQVLAEVFRHDVAAIFGDVHVDAHNAAACQDPSHTHKHP